MDKYTVDLDKVLNDFEYSELTHNYNANHSFAPESTSTYASSSKSKTGDARHSITNVFHSLNEYLNSDISGNGKLNRDNKSCLHNVTVVETDNNKVYDNKLNYIKDVRESDSVMLPDSLKNKSSIVKGKAFHSDIGDMIVNLQPSRNQIIIFEESKKIKESNEIVNSNSAPQHFNLQLETVHKNMNLPSENEIKLCNLRSGTLDKNTSVVSENDFTESVKLEESNMKLVLNNNENLIITHNTEGIGVKNCDSSITSDTKKINFSDNSDITETYISCNNESISITECDNSAAEDYINNEVEEETIKDSSLEATDTENNTKCTTLQESIRFDDTFDIDESALNKYLDALEEEYESQNFDVNIDTASLNEISNPVISESTVVTLVKQNNQLSVQTNINNVTELENTNESKDDIANNPKHVSEVLEKKTENTNENNDSIARGPICVSEVSEKKSEQLDVVSDNTETKHVLQDNDDCTLREIEEVHIKHSNSVERPKSLELQDSLSEVTLTSREINLIGNPGSTPYNNVYISEELHDTENKICNLEDSDSSTSASPTFSEVSTDTINSSDTTDTEIEEAHNKEHPQKGQRNKTAGKLTKEATNDPKALTNDDNVAANDATELSSVVAEGEQAVVIKPSTHEHENATANVEDVTDSTRLQSSQENTDMVIWLGKQAPLWIPDSETLSCLHCDTRFTVIKRRHHCRACGLVLCAKCCNLKYKLEYLDAEARVCMKCYIILNKDTNSSSGSEVSPLSGNSPQHLANQPNPNNPMEYCSVVPPLQQVNNNGSNPPSVMVPVGVLKRKGYNKGKSNKSVMFCDGIRPGSDLTKLDTDFNYSVSKSPTSTSKKVAATAQKVNRNIPPLDPVTKSFIPSKENNLPPTVTIFKTDITYTDCSNKESVVEMLKNEKLTFAVQRNLHVHVKIINMDCCINKQAWCFSTEGLISVGQDEIVYLIEVMENETTVPADIFHHINGIYTDAIKGTTVTEMGISLHSSANFLNFKNHAGFLYIRPTFQCLQNVIRPSEPYLIGLLIHRWETHWAKIFPLRLVLRLGAEYRYYPCPIISTRHRDSLYVEIGHTIINLLADFRNFSYTLPNIRGLTIHMEDKNTTVTIPQNRYDQVIKSLNNSSDHILAFGGNFSLSADSHLVCIQDTQGNNENAYTTHAINIHNKPRKVTGASFIVFNGALKSTSGLTAKSSIIEDGLMIQIPPEHMMQVRESLRNMRNHAIRCGCVNAPSDETVHIVWGEPDTNFNIGVTSPIDNLSFTGVPSIRVHNGKDYMCNNYNRLIRWTEVFILQNSDENSKTQDPIDISKIAEGIAKATCQALIKYLDLLTSNNFYKIGIRTTLHIENVSYSAGSNNVKLPPIYMKNLDNELIPVLHRITSNNLGENAVTLELIFHILNT